MIKKILKIIAKNSSFSYDQIKDIYKKTGSIDSVFGVIHMKTVLNVHEDYLVRSLTDSIMPGIDQWNN